MYVLIITWQTFKYVKCSREISGYIASSVTKPFHTEISDFSFKNIKRGVFLLSKIWIKNSVSVDTHIRKLPIYFGD